MATKTELPARRKKSVDISNTGSTRKKKPAKKAEERTLEELVGKERFVRIEQARKSIEALRKMMESRNV